MQARLDAKIILITGSTQGIGRAIAIEAATSGAEAIVVSGRNAKAGEAVVAELKALGTDALMIAEDLASPGAAERLFSKALVRFRSHRRAGQFGRFDHPRFGQQCQS